jgi:hypothetical protein
MHVTDSPVPYATATWRWWAAAATLARLPGNMAPLALVVALPGSPGAVAAACYTAGVGMAAAWRGRTIDRAGVRAGLRREAVLLAVASLLLSATMAAEVHGVLTAAAATALGMAGSAVGVAYRAALPLFVSQRSLRSAYTADAVLTELSFVASPLIVAVLAVTAPRPAMFLVAAALAAGSYLAGSALPRTAPVPSPSGPDTTGWLRAGAPVFAITAGIGLGYGLLVAGLPARLSELGWTSAAAAAAFAAMSATSAAVGLLFTVRGSSPRPHLRAVTALSVPFTVATAGLVVMPHPAAALAAMTVFGMPLALLSALGSAALGDRVPDGTLARAFAVFAATVTASSGVGFACAAFTLHHTGGTGTLAASTTVYLALSITLAIACRRTHVNDNPCTAISRVAVSCPTIAGATAALTPTIIAPPARGEDAARRAGVPQRIRPRPGTGSRMR